MNIILYEFKKYLRNGQGLTATGIFPLQGTHLFRSCQSIYYKVISSAAVLGCVKDFFPLFLMQ